MVVNFCGLRFGPRPNRSRDKDPEIEKCGLTASLVNCLKPRSSSLTAMKLVKKRPIDESSSKAVKDWIASSTVAGEGEMGSVHKQSSSRRIHPSDLKEELLLEFGDVKKKMKKKKVSFRSPEVAEVFVLDHYSPEMHANAIVCGRSGTMD